MLEPLPTPTARHTALAEALRKPVPAPPRPPVRKASVWEGLKVGGCYQWDGREPPLWEVVAATTEWAHLVPLGQKWPRLALSDPKEAGYLRKARRPPRKRAKL